MRTRRQQRESERAAKEASMQIEDDQEVTPKAEPVEEATDEEMGDEMEIEDAPEDAPLRVSREGVAGGLRIEPADGQPGDRLERILQILSEQQEKLELECEERLQRENENADRMREKMLKKIEMLPEEFLNSPTNDEAMALIRMPVMHNMPSFIRGKTQSMYTRVTRIFNKDTDADNILTEWNAKYEELDQLLTKDKEPAANKDDPNWNDEEKDNEPAGDEA